MSNTSKFFRVYIPVVKPGDFGPSGYAVWGEGLNLATVSNGDIVEARGDIQVCLEGLGCDEDTYEIAYRTVALPCGFVGRVCWQEYDGRSGFEAI